MLTPDDLIGLWNLKRKIVHQDGTKAGSMKGTAEFHKIGDQLLHYRENVIHTPAGAQSFHATSSYFYALEGRVLSIYFDTGKQEPRKLFLKIDFAKNACASHNCLADRYVMTMEAISAKYIAYAVTVQGPYKNYQLLTFLSR